VNGVQLQLVETIAGQSPEGSGVLVTGSSGFVGARLCRTLTAHGWRVVAASRQASGHPPIPGINDVRLSLSSGSESWQKALSSVRCVIHLAALAHQMGAASKAVGRFYEVNVEGSRFVAEEASRAGVRRFIFLSSVKVNGEGGGTKMYRADDLPNPQDAYGRSKLEAEMVLRDVCVRAGMELIVIRPPLIYGPGVRANFRRLLSLAALGLPLPFRSINNRRSMLGIWNLVNFIEFCMTHSAAAGQTWLISDGEDLSTPMLLQKLALAMGKPSRLFPLSPMLLKRVASVVGLGAEMYRLCDSLQVDSAPARERLHWQPPMSVDEGLAQTAAAYKIGHWQ
jgi:nucleoside-diphosphate-sugar epimerase